MGYEIHSFKSSDTKKYKNSLRIRYEVFVDEQLVDVSFEVDEFEDSSTHFICTEDKLPVATARIRKTKEGYKIERFAVIKSHRKKHIGSFLLGKIISKIDPSKNKIYIHSQDSAVKFYEKHSFQVVGDEFLDANIRHFKMILKH
jgi:predicted GNAT family N-acyltransferase